MAAEVSRRVGAADDPDVPLAAPAAGLPARRSGWTPGRVVALVAGSFLILVSVVLLIGAGVLTWADQEQQGGYLTTGTATYSADGYALASDPVSLHGPWGWLRGFAGEVRI